MDSEIIPSPRVTGELKYYGDNVTLGYALCQADLAKGRRAGRRAGDRRHGAGGRGRLLYHRGPEKALFEAVWQPGQSGRDWSSMLKAAFPGRGRAPARGRGRSSDVLLHRRRYALAEMRAFLSEKTKQNAAAFRAHGIWPSIPKNDAGKTLYRELEKYYVLICQRPSRAGPPTAWAREEKRAFLARELGELTRLARRALPGIRAAAGPRWARGRSRRRILKACPFCLCAFSRSFP